MLTCLLLTYATLARGQPNEREYDFDIERQALTQALRQFSLQTGLQLGYLPADPQDELVQVGPIKGRRSVADALRELLKPAGLTFTWVNDRTLSIEPPAAPPPPPRAQKKPIAKKAPKRNERRNAEVTPQTDHVLEEIVSTAVGGYLRYVGERAAPVRILRRESIEQTGVSTVADLMKYISQQTYMQPEAFRTSGAQHAELRGLGPDTTLVLINGRRTLASASTFVTNAFDLNTIPISAVERVEVLLDSASAVYGADAIGGIINVVLRNQIDHPSVDLNYGGADGGAEQRRVTFSGGYHTERAKGALVLDYFSLGHLLGAARDLWRDQDYRRFGSIDQRSRASAPGNIDSLLPTVNLPGLSSSFAAVPRTGSGTSTRVDGPVTIQEFLPTAGQSNDESLLKYFPIVLDARRLSLVGSTDVELAEHVHASAELLYTDRTAEYPFAPPVLLQMPVPASNPYNPFGTTVLASALLTDLAPQRQTIDSELLRAVAALRGTTEKWNWEVSLLSTHENAFVRLDNTLDQSRVLAALAQPDPSLALNVFEDGRAGSPQLLASLLAEPREDKFVSGGTQATAFVNGPLIELPAGAATVLVGSEWREEKARFDRSVPMRTRDVAAGFAELRIPLLSRDETESRRGIGELTMTLGGRLDDYSDFGSIFNPQYGFIWRPYRDLTLRYASGRSFRPPSMFELFFPRVSVPGLPVVDPRRHELASVTLITGGNRDLVATRGNSLTTGFVFSPAALSPLQISGSYWRMKMDDRVTLLPLTLLLANEASFPDRVVRAEPTPAEAAAGIPGRLLSLDTSRMNFGRLETSGIDASVSYEFDTSLGRLIPALSATWIDEFKTVDLPSTPATNRVDVANSFGTIARWRLIGTLGWQRGPLRVTTYARYLPSYADALPSGARNGRTIPAQTIIDLQASLDLDTLVGADSDWRGVKLTAGAADLFDEQPAFAEIGDLQGFDQSQGDLKGRFCYIRLGKSF